MAARGARLGVFIGAFASLAACASAAVPVETAPRPLTALEQSLHAHVAVLASDEFAGREVGTAGEGLTLDYLEHAFEEAGLHSGTHDPGHPWREPIEYSRRGLTVRTHNFIARLAGSEPQAGAVLLIAHWDHLGAGPRCRKKGVDTICNGAVDNASGLAMMIEIARALNAGPPPKRDIYFLATGGEEDGLRGAAAFASDPPVPLDKFVAAFNLDTEGIAPPHAPAVALTAPGPLQALIARTAADEGVTLVAPDKRNIRFLKRQDGWVFEVEGIPAALVSTAFAQGPRLDHYMHRRYHRANDEADGIEMGGAADMVRFHTELLLRTADPAIFPRQAAATANGN